MIKEKKKQGKPKKGKQPVQAAMESLGSAVNHSVKWKAGLRRASSLSKHLWNPLVAAVNRSMQ